MALSGGCIWGLRHWTPRRCLVLRICELKVCRSLAQMFQNSLSTPMRQAPGSSLLEGGPWSLSPPSPHRPSHTGASPWGPSGSRCWELLPTRMAPVLDAAAGRVSPASCQSSPTSSVPTSSWASLPLPRCPLSYLGLHLCGCGGPAQPGHCPLCGPALGTSLCSGPGKAQLPARMSEIPPSLPLPHLLLPCPLSFS